jgi:hypothetical protein
MLPGIAQKVSAIQLNNDQETLTTLSKPTKSITNTFVDDAERLLNACCKICRSVEE